MINVFINFVTNNSIFIQALSSFILVIVTIYYAIITNKILHASYRTYLKPISFTLNNNKWTIRVKNFGPGNALFIKFKSIVMKNMMMDPYEGLNKIWYETEMKAASGAIEIVVNQEGEFYFESGLLDLSLTDPFFIEWTTITGKKQKSGWLYNTGYQISEFRPMTRNEKIKFGINRIKIEIKSPYVNLCRKLRFKKYSQSIKK